MSNRSIGTRMNSLKSLKQSMKKKQAGLVQYIPKNGEITVRFLEEPEGCWVRYGEHYDQMRRQSFPCIGEGCSGCEEDLRRTDRYLANALDIEKDKAITIQLPKGLAETLVKYYERNSTIMDRDYTLVREGEGLETDYYPQPEEKYDRKLTQYEVADIDEILESLANDYFGEPEVDDDEVDEEEPFPVKKPARKQATKKPKVTKRERPPEPDEDDEDDDVEPEEEDVPAPKPRTNKKAAAAPKKAPARKPRPTPEDDDEDDVELEVEEDDVEPEEEDLPTEPEAEEADDDEDDEYTESELAAMPIGELRVIARSYGIKTAGLDQAELLDAIFEDG